MISVDDFNRQLEQTLTTIARSAGISVDLKQPAPIAFIQQMHRFHYDWWAFPIDEFSTRPEFALTLELKEALPKNPEYMKRYRWFSQAMAFSFGVSLDGTPVPKELKKARGGGVPVRLWKVLKSWLLIGDPNWVTTFTRSYYSRASEKHQQYLRILFYYRMLRDHRLDRLILPLHPNRLSYASWDYLDQNSIHQVRLLPSDESLPDATLIIDQEWFWAEAQPPYPANQEPPFEGGIKAPIDSTHWFMKYGSQPW